MAKSRMVNKKRSRPLVSNLYVLIMNPSRANSQRTPTPNLTPSEPTSKRPASKRRCLCKADIQEKENVKGDSNASDEVDLRTSAQQESTMVPEASSWADSENESLDWEPQWDSSEGYPKGWCAKYGNSGD
ncbi:hypothetical protein N7507_010431 [Penicillium longicatenatum]|nr:hypothetical protein N7507_010431 [Penicillium longicatenatum]